MTTSGPSWSPVTKPTFHAVLGLALRAASTPNLLCRVCPHDAPSGKLASCGRESLRQTSPAGGFVVVLG